MIAPENAWRWQRKVGELSTESSRVRIGMEAKLKRFVSRGSLCKLCWRSAGELSNRLGTMKMELKMMKIIPVETKQYWAVPMAIANIFMVVSFVAQVDGETGCLLLGLGEE
ncbi:hypothetical protein V6N13_118184 [Hibiscus sabdariffa]